MLLTTTPTIEGRRIKEYKGMVSAEVILGAHIGRDFLANLRDFFGGRSRAYEKVLHEAKKEALQVIIERAQERGANAVVGIDYDFEVVGQGGSMLMVHISGTAVVLEQ